MYELLQDISRRPEPFSRYTAMELWTRPHLARQMLSFHLNQETELASRRFETIDQIVNWIDSQLVFPVSVSVILVADQACPYQMLIGTTAQPNARKPTVETKRNTVI